jgi:tetratricopeptide (TPR) repeat protein
MSSINPDLIIKYLFNEYERYLQRIDVASKKVWGELIFPENPDKLDFNHFNRLKQKKNTTTALIRTALENQETLRRIASRLNCPGLFESLDYAELLQILTPSLLVESQARPVLGRALVIPKPFADGINCISQAEEQAIKTLVFRIKENRSCVACWKDAPAVGTMFIAYALGGTYLQDLGIRHAYVLCPFAGYTDAPPPTGYDNQAPFGQALGELREHLGLLPGSTARKLLSALELKDAIVLVVHPDKDHETGTSELRELVKAAGNSEGSNTRVLLMGRPEHGIQNCRNFSLQVAVSKEAESNDFFEQQWKRYCLVRGHAPADEQGARLKRAQTYYVSDHGVSTRPAAVRMLAFLASNYDTFSYFDPTAGWGKLANMSAETLPIEIRLHVDEVCALLQSVQQGHALRAVEWCSTALYWLTQEAAAELIGLHKGMKSDTFKSAVNKVHGMLITTAPSHASVGTERKPRSEIYKMDLAARALAQDRWMRRDSYGRACAHHLIAKRLFIHCNDKALLSKEFPFEPHWGRSRIHFLAECLRHLLRACDLMTQVKPGLPQTVLNADPPNEFPKPPVRRIGSGGGCDPNEVVNFCFDKIFWQELNGNSRTGNVHNRKLARQHGAYQLAGEVLELLSHEHQLGQPHLAMDPKYHARYFREVVYAQLDLGDLEESLKSCERLIRLSGSGSDITLGNVEYHLDRTVVLTAMDRIDEASSLLDQIDGFVRKMDKNPEKIDIRLKARRAQLEYLRGDFLSALQTYELIAAKGPAAIVRDVAHTYIATLGALGGAAHLQRGLTICLQNLFHNSSSGLHHEALGFRVALAHLLRKTGTLDAAEATLDQVLYDILQFGCSERTYLAFLLEAGRVVLSTPQRAARAYAAYLRPCLERAISLGYVRAAKTAGKEAERCLVTLLKRLQNSPGESSEEVRKLLVDARAIAFVSRRPEVDPRYSFGATQVETWLPRLATVAAVTIELAGLGSVKSQLDAINDQSVLSAGGSLTRKR